MTDYTCVTPKYEACALCGLVHNGSACKPAKSAHTPREEDAGDEAQDFKLIETGFSYWAVTLNRVAARLALGRVKKLLAAERERAHHAEQRANIAEAEETRVKAGLGSSLEDWMALTKRAVKAEGEAKALREALLGMMPESWDSTEMHPRSSFDAIAKARAALVGKEEL